MKAVTAREANQAFSKLLAAAEAGEEVVITKRGKPVVRMIAYDADHENKKALVLARLKKRIARGYRLGGVVPSRDQLHERGR